MKHTFILLAVSALLFSACSSAYKAAQTPDDVYYSPAKEYTGSNDVTSTNRDRYQENINTQDDRFLRMKIQNRDRWQTIDDYGYWYDSRYDFNSFNNYPYSNNFNYNRYAMNNWHTGYGFNTMFNPNYYGYGGYYAASYPVIYYKNPKVYSGVTGKSNLATYMNTRYNNQNTGFRKGDASNGFGNLVRKVLVPNSNGNSSNSNTYERPARSMESTSTPSSSAGGRSGGYSSSGSSTGTSRPPRN